MLVFLFKSYEFLLNPKSDSLFLSLNSFTAAAAVKLELEYEIAFYFQTERAFAFIPISRLLPTMLYALPNLHKERGIVEHDEGKRR